MKEKKSTRLTVNIRIYKDTHKLLKEHTEQYRSTIAGTIHGLAMGLVAAKRV